MVVKYGRYFLKGIDKLTVKLHPAINNYLNIQGKKFNPFDYCYIVY
jgi:hypothetical protein